MLVQISHIEFVAVEMHLFGKTQSTMPSTVRKTSLNHVWLCVILNTLEFSRGISLHFVLIKHKGLENALSQLFALGKCSRSSGLHRTIFLPCAIHFAGTSLWMAH